MRSLFVLIFALSMIACGDGDRQPENQSSNPLYPSGSEQVQRGQIVTGEGSAVSGAEVVIIDAERLVVLARAPVDDQGGFVVSVPQRPSYWLGISGPYMTTYIDTAFAFTGEAIIVGESPRSHAAGKATQVVGILGDVNNDNQVDIADALLVLLYTLERFSFVAPNQGNIALGDVNEDGQIDIADVLFIMTYIANPLDPTLPDGIGLATEQTTIAIAVEQDRAVLIALYEATDGDNWYDNTNWLSSTYPLAQWYGVETDDEGRVTSLDLNWNGLTGPIPEALGQLHNLQYLNLSYNDLAGGEILEALVQLNDLQYLGLIDNDLTGTIPEALGQLDSLHTLYLADNDLMGCIPSALHPIPDHDLYNLELTFCVEMGNDRSVLLAFYAATGGNHWMDNTNWLSEGPLSEWYGVTTDDEGRVTELDLLQNQLTGPIPETLGQLNNLLSLNLSLNWLSGPIPETLGQLDSLETLALAGNQLSGPIPEALGQLNNLRFLSLADNQLSGPIPEALRQLNNLRSLYLSGNQLTGCIPSALQDALGRNDLGLLGLAFCLSETTPEIVSLYDTLETTPEIVSLYDTLISIFTNIFFAAIIPGTTSVPGEGGGSVEISGNDWALNEYSPDGELIANGALNIDLTQDPIPMSGEVTLSGSHEAELILDIQLSVGTDGLSATGTITINGSEFDVAEVSAAAAAG